MNRTKDQNAELHLLMTQLKYPPETKQDLAYSFSKGRTERTSELTFHACRELLEYLRRELRSARMSGHLHPPGSDEDKADRQRKKFLSHCYQLGWTLKDGKLDWDRIGNWLEKYGYKHVRNLNDYEVNELPRLVSQIESVLKTESK